MAQREDHLARSAYDEVKHYNEVCQLNDAQVWELVAEIERLRAALKGYDIMLTHFEHAWLEQKAKAREAHGPE